MPDFPRLLGRPALRAGLRTTRAALTLFYHARWGANHCSEKRPANRVSRWEKTGIRRPRPQNHTDGGKGSGGENLSIPPAHPNPPHVHSKRDTNVGGNSGQNGVCGRTTELSTPRELARAAPPVRPSPQPLPKQLPRRPLPRSIRLLDPPPEARTIPGTFPAAPVVWRVPG